MKRELCYTIPKGAGDMDIIIAKNIRTEKTIRKSRFICSLQRVESEEEAKSFIKDIKKEYWDATHNCSAYIIDEQQQRSNDDGEPSGTAGIPMLEVLRKQQVVQVAAVVTRYFGGVKLGAGGLIRAYSGAVAQALAEAGLAKKVKLGLYVYKCSNLAAGKLQNLLYRQSLFTLVSVEYGNEVAFTLQMEEKNLSTAQAWLTDALQKQTELQKVGETFKEALLR